ncbi:MAG: four-helix bundle copper-binding protein [Actinomycetota bacterium]|nr:four-helix bundle copper-binding protein [Actinomycetota bacterium]
MSAGLQELRRRCQRHAENMGMEHCKVCAEACRQCEAACQQLLAVIGG